MAEEEESSESGDGTEATRLSTTDLYYYFILLFTPSLSFSSFAVSFSL